MKLGNVNQTPNYTFRRRQNPAPLIIAGVLILLGILGVWQVVGAITGSKPQTSAENPAVTPTLDVASLATPSAPGSTPAVTMQIVDSVKGSPVSDASIKIGDAVVARSDSAGNFSFYKSLPSGTNNLILSAPGYRDTTISTDSLNAGTALKLQPLRVKGTVIDGETKRGVAGKTVSIGAISAKTGTDGSFRLDGVPNGGTLTVQGTGYKSASLPLAPDVLWPELTVDLVPNLMHMTIKDDDGTAIKHGEVLIFDGAGKQVMDASAGTPLTVSLDASGAFSVNDVPEDGSIHIRAPGYKIKSIAAKDLADGKTISMPKFISKAVYIPGIFATEAYHDDPENGYKWFLKLADNTEINTFVISIKDDDRGLLYYPSKLPLVKQYDLTFTEYQMDVAKVIKEAHDHGVYVSARYVVFRDPAIASANNSAWAVRSKSTGKPWQDKLGLRWPNQTIPDVRQYNLDLAKELASLGFDEVQFDYVRFPTDGNIEDGDWGVPVDEKLRTDTISNFVGTAHDYLKKTDTFLSIDVFGITPWREDDNNIGQNYAILVNKTDYICPMIYPSHFNPGDDGFDNPNAHPYEIITDSSVKAVKKGENAYSKYRPWLQDFTYKKPAYGPAEVRTQIKAAEANGSWGWILWNAAGNYQTDALIHKK